MRGFPTILAMRGRWAMALWLVPLAALGQAEDVYLQVRDRVPAGQQPAVRVTARRDVPRITITLRRADGKSFELGGALAAGETREFAWPQAAGTMRYTGEADVQYVGGGGGKIVLDFAVTVLEPLKIRVEKGGFSLNRKVVRVTASRPLVKAEVELRSPEGKVLGKVERALSAPDSEGRFEVAWEQQEAGTIGRVIVVGHDSAGFWARVEVVPLSIYIPHDEVIFDTGSARIRSQERPKLEATLDLIRQAMARNAEVQDLRLYIAGYTDTVAGREYNLKLSRRRARAIARHFRRLGLRLPIFYQGFGEDVLAVATPDETPEARNRRAIYLLANHTPEISKHFPRADWRPLR
jgi:outer membrane protein OmpA-like peptidoglycan-associated protein